MQARKKARSLLNVRSGVQGVSLPPPALSISLSLRVRLSLLYSIARYMSNYLHAHIHILTHAASVEWSSIDRAQGVKVKDDAGLLRKTITKAAKVKAKRAEKWTKRATDIEDSRTKRIEQRNDNIKKRIQDRRDKKMGIKKKKTKAK